MKNIVALIGCLFALAQLSSSDAGQQISEGLSPRILMCYSDPWVLADTSAWPQVLERVDIIKIYIGNISGRMDTARSMALLYALHSRGIKVAGELGGLVDWHADKMDRSAEYSFAEEYASLKPLIEQMKRVDPDWNIDMLDMDGPVRRMLFPNNTQRDYHTIESAVGELLQAVSLWRDSIPGIEINLLTNFPNWGWGGTPAYFSIDGRRNGYGQYEDVLETVAQASASAGIYFDGLTIDNPYDYMLGLAPTNQPGAIAGVDWFRRIKELDAVASQMGLRVNMIFNTNGARTPEEYSEQTLECITAYQRNVGIPGGY